MKKVYILTVCFYVFLCAGVLLAGQIILFNKTGRPVAFSLKFFHNQAEQKMVIGDFKLKSREKITFPQQKDLNIANLRKLKVHWPNNQASTKTKKFGKGDARIHNIEILSRSGELSLQEKL